MANLRGTLCIALLMTGICQQVIARGVQTQIAPEVTPQGSAGDINDRYPERKEAESTDFTPQQNGQQHNLDDLVRIWHNQEGENIGRIPLWNPTLVKLIHRYLLSHKTSSINSMGAFLGVFKQLSKSQSNSRLISANKDKNDKLLGGKNLEDEAIQRRVKRFAEHRWSRKESNGKVDDPFTATSKLLKQGPYHWMLPEDPGVYDQGMDFTIPLHNPNGLHPVADNAAWNNADHFQVLPITNNHNGHRAKRAIYSGFPKYYDQFHPLSYTIKDYGKAQKSQLYPFGTTGYYGDGPVYNRKHRKHARRASSFHPLKSSEGYKSENYGFYDELFGDANSKFPGKGNYEFPNFKVDPGLYSGFEDFDYNQDSKSLYGFPEKKNYAGSQKSGLPADVDMQALVSLYSSLFKNSRTGRANARRLLRPMIDSGGLVPMVDETQGARAVMTPVTRNVATVTPPTTTTQIVPITAPRTPNPCDGIFTSGASGIGVSKNPCYYVPPTTTTVNSITESATTTPCPETHSSGTSHTHYHANHIHPTYPTTRAEPIWTEFEIIQEGLAQEGLAQEGLWETKTPKPSISDQENIDRHFLITAPPAASRFKITEPPPYLERLPDEYLESMAEYPIKRRKKTRITGTIELRRDKNKKPRYVVKLPFDTGQLPFTIRRLIISKFTDWPRTDGARNAVTVTMDPNCSSRNSNCSNPSASGDSADIIVEVDSALFDKKQFYDAVRKAHLSARTALDLEELVPSWQRRHGKTLHKVEKFNSVDKHHGKSMSPSTQNPLSVGNEDLPAETPDWLRNIINRFTKKENWTSNLKGKQVHNDGGATVARLLPAKDSYELDSIEVLPQHMALLSGATAGTTKAMSPWFVLSIWFLLYLIS